jgi:hypothetical protein
LELRRYVQDRLAGQVKRPDGTTVAGPLVPWIGRRHGRRKNRRWAGPVVEPETDRKPAVVGVPG